MARPVFLVIEVEQPDGLSTRKLVLETAKYNVLTAHSGKEGLEIAETHPVDAIILHHGMKDVPIPKLARKLKSIGNGTPLVYLAPNINVHIPTADHVVNSHDPGALLNLMQDLVGRPAESAY